MTAENDDGRSLAADPASGVRAKRSRTSVARGGVVGVVGAAVGTLGGFLLVLVATRGLGAAGSGRFFVAVAVFTVLTNVGKLGTDTGMVRFVARALARGRSDEVRTLLARALRPTVLVSLVLGAVLVLAAVPISQTLYAVPTDGDASLVQLAGIFVPLGTTTLVLLAVTRGFGSVASFVLVEQVVKPVLRPLLVGLVCLLGGTVTDAVLAWLLPVVIGLMLALRSVSRVVPPRNPPGRGVAAEEAEHLGAKEFWSFVAPRSVAGTLEILAPWLGVLLLSGLAGNAEAGTYTAVTRLVTAGTMVLVAMRLALGPHVSAAFAQGDTRRLDLLHEHSTIWSVLVSFPAFVCVAVFPEAVLSIFGPGFDDGAAALVILVAANLVNVAVGNVQTMILMGGRSLWNLANTGAALAAQIGVAALLIPRWGITGAGIGLAAGVLVNNVLSAVQARGGLGIRVWPPSIMVAIALSVATTAPVAVLGRWWAGSSLGVFALSLACGSLLLLATVVAWPRLLDLQAGWRVLTRGFAGERSAR